VIRDGVEAARAFEKSEIMRYESETQKGAAEASGEFAAGVEVTGIGAQAYAVGEQGYR
jgi:hypothetical protein